MPAVLGSRHKQATIDLLTSAQAYCQNCFRDAGSLVRKVLNPILGIKAQWNHSIKLIHSLLRNLQQAARITGEHLFLLRFYYCNQDKLEPTHIIIFNVFTKRFGRQLFLTSVQR